MAHAEGTVTIAGPIAEGFAFVANGENNAKWRPSVLDVTRGPGGGGTGTTSIQGLKGPGGRRIAGDYQITVYAPPTTLGFDVIAGPARPSGLYEFGEPNPGQTVVHFALDLKPRGLMLFMAPMINRQMRNEVACLEQLKAVLDG